jgi:hypothetical protein
MVTDAPRRAGMPAVLVVMPANPATADVWGSMRQELADEMDVVTLVVDASTTPQTLAAKIDDVERACVVVMNNPTLMLYREYQSQPGAKEIPVVIAMTSFLEDIHARVRNAIGIAYEIPAVTVYVNLRQLISRPI